MNHLLLVQIQSFEPLPMASAQIETFNMDNVETQGIPWSQKRQLLYSSHLDMCWTSMLY